MGYRQAQAREHAQAHVAVHVKFKARVLLYERDNQAFVVVGVDQRRQSHDGGENEHSRYTNEYGE
jgi:hypothetical protein